MRIRRVSAAAAVAVLLSLAATAQPPAPAGAAAPAPVHVSFRTSDGVTLRGHLWPGGETAFVLSHMYLTTQAIWYDLAGHLAAQGHTVLTYDFRGVGSSSGRFVIARVYRDTIAAVRFVRGRNPKKVILVGASMGGTASIMAAGQTDVEGLIVIASGTTFQGLDVHPYLPRLRVSKLFIVGSGDRPFVNSARKMYALAPKPKQLIIIPTGRHGTHMFEYAPHRDRIYRAIASFPASAVAGTRGP